MPRFYFLTLFACCRESYVGGKDFAANEEGNDDEDGTAETEKSKARGGDVKVSSVLPANFCFVFGCNPADGV